MSEFTINVPIREEDAEDVKNAFAAAYGYSDTINTGDGALGPNPITKEQFVQQCCINFMLNITKNYLVKVEEIAATNAAVAAVAVRTQEVTQWFDSARLESIGGIAVYQQFPQISDVEYSFNQNTSYEFTLSGTDPDNLPLTFEITKNPTMGVLSGTNPEFTYNPYENMSGTDTLKFKANNGTKNSLEGTITFKINGAPFAASSSVDTTSDTNINITLVGIDPENDELSYTVLSQPSLGVLSGIAPDLIYVPGGVAGTDSFTFKVSDGQLESAEATVTINIA
jgi:hypothetical protein